MKKNLNSIAIVIVTMALSMGALSAYAQTATQGLCISSFEYEIDPANATSTYDWGIDDGTSGTDWDLTKNNEKATVDWKVAGTYNLWSQETNEYGCVGPKGYVTVTVSDRPTTPALENNICSATQAGGTVDVVTLELATGFSKYVFKGLTIPTGVEAAAGNVALTVGQEINGSTELDIIAGDAYTNSTSGVLDVVYTFAPYSATCGDLEGDEFTVTIHVYPEVKAPTIKF